MALLVLHLETEVSQLSGRPMPHAVRFLSWLGLCVQSGRLVEWERSQDVMMSEPDQHQPGVRLSPATQTPSPMGLTHTGALAEGHEGAEDAAHRV